MLKKLVEVNGWLNMGTKEVVGIFGGDVLGLGDGFVGLAGDAVAVVAGDGESDKSRSS